MNQFKIKATKYSEVGSLTNDYSVFYFANADIAHAKYDELNRQYQTDEEGKQTGNKTYKVELFTQTFKKVEDVTAFFATLE